MEEYGEGAVEFAVLAVVQDPLVDITQKLLINIRTLQQLNDRLIHLGQRSIAEDPDCSHAIVGQSVELGITDQMLDSVMNTDDMDSKTAVEDVEQLRSIARELIAEQQKQMALFKDEQQINQRDDELAAARRADHAVLAAKWLMLAEKLDSSDDEC